MPTQVQSWVLRTLVPLIVGLIIAYALKIGLHLTSPSVTVWVTSAVTAGYVALARFVEVKWPAIGKYLVSLGLVTAQPVYKLPAAAVPPTPAGPRALSPEGQVLPATPKGEFPADQPKDLF